jgi:hypothetical protein
MCAYSAWTTILTTQTRVEQLTTYGRAHDTTYLCDYVRCRELIFAVKDRYAATARAREWREKWFGAERPDLHANNRLPQVHPQTRRIVGTPIFVYV